MSDFPDTAHLFAGGEWSSVPAHETADNVTCEAYVPASRLSALTAERDALQEQLTATLKREAETHIRLFDKLHDLRVENERMRKALKEAGDVIESYRASGIDLGEASRMPFAKDTLAKIDAALATEKKP